MARVRRIILTALATMTLFLAGLFAGSAAAGAGAVAPGGPPFQCPFC
jgi:hypothetical protein